MSDPIRGAQVFAAHGASCHGATGRGTRSGPDLRDEAPEHSDARIAQVIREGNDDMPPIAIAPQEIGDVIAHLRVLFGPLPP